jgi:hypothetical protein
MQQQARRMDEWIDLGPIALRIIEGLEMASLKGM